MNIYIHFYNKQINVSMFSFKTQSLAFNLKKVGKKSPHLFAQRRSLTFLLFCLLGLLHGAKNKFFDKALMKEKELLVKSHNLIISLTELEGAVTVLSDHTHFGKILHQTNIILRHHCS